MKYGTLFLLLISFLSMRLQAITEEPYFYYFKILSKKTNEEIPFVSLKLIMNDTVIGTGITGINGIGFIEASRKMKNASLQISATGFKTSEVINLNMKIKDTLVSSLSENIQQLDAIEIVSYRVPKIDPEPKSVNRKKLFAKKKKFVPPPPELIIEYTREELTTRQELLDGVKISDTLTKGSGSWSTNWFSAVAKTIKYPEKARDAEIQEKLYFQLSFNNKGRLSQIKLLKGNDPALVLAAFKAFTGLPYPSIPRGQGVEFQLPILFNLK
ncbi:MAG: Gram-negative bacterial TonB protein C-terminal [Bacteroidetes bacterium]|jgi:hypothetical protein|nr:Gram-negative bacterial TonB protein C-terminal [Bacteroidota bacterium]